MIWLVQQLAAGNALRLLLAPASGAVRWRLLRKDTDTFAGESDPEALVVMDGTEKAVTDFAGLLNDTEVFYRLYSRVGGAWVASPTKAATPTAPVIDLAVDPLSLIRDRIEVGFKVFVDRGVIRHDQNFVPVMTASPQVEDVGLPLVTIHLQNAAMEVRAIGEVAAPDLYDEDDSVWHTFEGGFDRVTLTIVCWSVNADQRKSMRKVLRAILQANLPVFDAAGLVTPSWSMQDMEDYVTYAVPMFQTICTFDCLAPAAIQSVDLPIIEADALASAIQP